MLARLGDALDGGNAMLYVRPPVLSPAPWGREAQPQKPKLNNKTEGKSNKW